MRADFTGRGHVFVSDTAQAGRRRVRGGFPSAFIAGAGCGTSRILFHIAALTALYLAFSVALFLGLQVDPLYGNLGVAAACALAGLYVWLGFVRR